MIEPQLELGLGQRAGHRLARFDLGDFFAQILGALRVGRRHPQPGETAARGFTIEHCQERRLAHVAMTEKRHPLGPGETALPLDRAGWSGAWSCSWQGCLLGSRYEIDRDPKRHN